MSDFAKPRGGCTLQWKIENFSFCPQGIGECIESEIFATENLQTITPVEWVIRLYPRGKDDKEYLACYVHRNDVISNEIAVDFSISLISVDGSIHCLQEYKGQTFKPGDEVECSNLEMLEKIWSEKREFLPLDTLTIQCRMWVPTSYQTNSIMWSAVTHIRKLKFSRDYKITSFSDWKVGDEKCLDIYPGICMIALLNVLSSSNTELPPDKFIQFFIRDYELNSRNGIYISCRISVVDTNGVISDFVEGEKFLTSNQTNKLCVLSNQLNHNKLTANPDLYLLNDELHLICEIITSQDKPPISYIDNLGIYTTAEIPKKILPMMENTLKEDLNTIYSKELFWDVTLQAKNGSCHAHKTILCARSSKFRKMLESDTKVCHSSIVELQDLDLTTLKHLLLYIYTEQLKYLPGCGNVKDLYDAANIYGVPGLIKECSSIISSKLVNEDVCEVLSLAVQHKDNYLMEEVMDYIATHKEVIISQKWTCFVQKKCSAETLQKVLVKIAQQK